MAAPSLERCELMSCGFADDHQSTSFKSDIMKTSKRSLHTNHSNKIEI
jgi:hypothetical protein